MPKSFGLHAGLEAVDATEFGTKTALDKFYHHTVPALESILIKAPEKEPARRYQSARERRVDLERLSSGVAVGSVPIMRIIHGGSCETTAVGGRSSAGLRSQTGVCAGSVKVSEAAGMIARLLPRR